jgi:hypothetical protein
MVIWTHQFYKIEHIFWQKKFEIKFKNLPDGTKDDIRMNGVRVNMFCNGYSDTLLSAANFAKMFLGGLSSEVSWLNPFSGSEIKGY